MSNTSEMYLIILTVLIEVSFFPCVSVTISTSTFFDGLLVTGLYTSTSVQASQLYNVSTTKMKLVDCTRNYETEQKCYLFYETIYNQ